MPSRSLKDLCPELREIAGEFKQQCLEAGIEILIYCTYRSNAEQDAEYAKGRTAKGQKVTNAKGGQSMHNCTDLQGSPSSKAFDCVPMKNNICQWNDLVSYETMGEIGEGLGLVWGGRWKQKDRPHFQLEE
jgi:peptidoglycan L-alanyl-D-glutamate endopeptidase CwlK